MTSRNEKGGASQAQTMSVWANPDQHITNPRYEAEKEKPKGKGKGGKKGKTDMLSTRGAKAQKDKVKAKKTT